MAEPVSVPFVMAIPSAVEGGGREPPDRKEGQRERSSGSEVPVEDEGERWDRMAAACGVGQNGWNENSR